MNRKYLDAHSDSSIKISSISSMQKKDKIQILKYACTKIMLN